MKLEITKDWAGFSKGDFVEITDRTVIKKGFEIKLFKGKEPKEEEEDLKEESEK
jgi:hypothetical protein